MWRRSKRLLTYLLARRYHSWARQGNQYLEHWLRQRGGA